MAMLKILLEIFCVLVLQFGTTKAAAATITVPAEDVSETIAHDVPIGTELEHHVESQDLAYYTVVQTPDDETFRTVEEYPYLYIAVNKSPQASSYSIVVTAHGSDGADTRTITVTVTQPVPNNHAPVFQSVDEPYKILEDSGIGTSVTTVTATDDDSTSPENEVTYFISGSEFTINPTSGLITVAGALDFTTQQVHELVVTARDGAPSPRSASVTVTVSLQTRPQWSSPTPGSPQTKTIPETISDVTDIYSFTATDEDGGVVQYSISSQSPAAPKMFVIDGNILRRKSDVTLDVDASNAIQVYTLTLRASDGDYDTTSDVTLEITLTDENDCSPVFNPSEYSIDYEPEKPLADYTLTVTATDADYTTENNVITYSLKAEDEAYFAINAATGEITILDTITMDTITNYVSSVRIVIATDSGNPPKTGTATVKLIDPTLESNRNSVDHMITLFSSMFAFYSLVFLVL